MPFAFAPVLHSIKFTFMLRRPSFPPGATRSPRLLFILSHFSDLVLEENCLASVSYHTHLLGHSSCGHAPLFHHIPNPSITYTHSFSPNSRSSNLSRRGKFCRRRVSQCPSTIRTSRLFITSYADFYPKRQVRDSVTVPWRVSYLCPSRSFSLSDRARSAPPCRCSVTPTRRTAPRAPSS